MPAPRSTRPRLSRATGRADDAVAWARRNPYATLAGAVGVGFVIGGGLFTRLTARLVGAGLRMSLVAAAPLLREALVQSVAPPLRSKAAATRTKQGDR